MIFSSKTRARVLLVLRIALGAVFVYAAILKLTDPWELFAGAIADYKLLPPWAVIALARSLPWAELAIGALLCFGLFLRSAASACTLLLLVFFGLMVRAYIFHMQISCGCFGPGELISWRTLLRDGSLLGVSAVVSWLAFARKRAAKSISGAELSPAAHEPSAY